MRQVSTTTSGISGSDLKTRCEWPKGRERSQQLHLPHPVTRRESSVKQSNFLPASAAARAMAAESTLQEHQSHGNVSHQMQIH